MHASADVLKINIDGRQTHGARPSGVDAGQAAPNHGPYFDIDGSALKSGVRVLAGLALDFLLIQPKK